ncbi:hypothetical protein SMACR_00514 [Sordaria macrospora]|uniref:WGS project CABT00000000 data, contig 2.1 n=2 Tax=Sordaria macrospora TaxID=5147 RepID=F7VLC0_SORMK|nr:uncharacterized protein SMAC_00514 [Sordaria macrospora k-hell]KAA8635418.1 hypothetical protein SMACR_00514 [Sordaria macrospora]WPJ59265.1 hypothetical protein SMAC4_00514 [Sordaria macrospora]CCC06297.1 unnamed protein product [Sordaria macrospora k-hell]
MPPGRPPKRPSEAGDAPLDNGSQPKMKLPRLERSTEDFSSVVKTKLSQYTRTGQACDRCKVRKIRCDASPAGCSHCASQNIECVVTDRVTGRTERRGYTQQLEAENNSLLNHIRSLEKVLEDHGVEVRPWEGSSANRNPYPPGVTLDAMGNPIHDPMSQGEWQQQGSVWVRKSRQGPQNTPSRYTRCSLLESRPTESYLGVSLDSEPLSSIKGTTLSVLGTTIDITSFDAPDMDEPSPTTPTGSPLYNKSVMAFYQSIVRINPPMEHCDLPSRNDAFTYAQWYFLTIYPFMPLVHRPSFMQLLGRIYDEPGFKATVPELVVVHMLFATIYFQYGVRNREKPEEHAQLNNLSNKHYHWSLSKFFELAVSQTVTAVQALAMLASHTRNFPKPGCSFTIANFAMMKAIELNFHRSNRIPNGGTTLENELRKRVWWSILGIIITLNGRLGRPMPITLEEFDIEFPIAINDEYLGEDGVLDPSKIGHCCYQIGLAGFRAVPLYMEMYSSIYSVRRDPKKYLDVVFELERAMEKWKSELPDCLRVDKCQHTESVFALYTEAISLEFHLCLRHPSVCLEKDKAFCADNTRKCEEIARKLLKVLGELLKIKSLDTTWYQLSVYVASILSILVANWERRHEITHVEIATLRADMALGLEIIGEIGRLLGNRLASEIGTITERTIAWIERDMTRKDGLSVDQTIVKQPSVSPFQQPLLPFKQPLNGNGMPSSNSVTSNDHRSSVSTNGTGYYDGSATPYQTMSLNDNGHPTSNGVNLAPYDPSGGSAQYLYATATPTSTTATPQSVTAAMDQTSSATNPLIAFASQATQHVSATGQSGTGPEDWRPLQVHPQFATASNTPNNNPWHDWAAAMADSQERYSASALLTLGSTRPGEVSGAGMVGHSHAHVNGGAGHGTGGGADGLGVSMAVSAAASAVGGGGQWPLLLFSDVIGNGNGS